LESNRGWGFCIILPIHDELIIQCPRSSLHIARKVLSEVRRLMVQAGDYLKVPLEVDIEISTHDWESKQPFSLEEVANAEHS